MLSNENFPDIIFVDEDGHHVRFSLRAATPRVRAVAEYLGDRFNAGSVIGLMLPTGPHLVTNWLGCVLAGLEPLVLQYPTKKQSGDYLSSSIGNTVGLAGIAVIIADNRSHPFAAATGATVVAQEVLASLADGATDNYSIDSFAIVQLSSGTTGHRKAIRFLSEDLWRHVDDFNQTLCLTTADRIASWLPLYHDMGYIACFVMPLLLGVEMVLMDPMAWVRRPALLSDAIARHDCTICYMPNFGFEVMSRNAPRPMPSMRLWISCSEPVSAATTEKFLKAADTEPSRFAVCYAMAENIFAIALRPGIKIATIDMADVVSCGPPIKDVEVRSFEGELWVRSPTSLPAYIGGGSICDAEGCYPTGDLGGIIDGEIYVTGRKQDLLIQAGRKFMLSDIDLALNQLFPEIRGRAATLVLKDEILGTEQLVMLIEAQDFIVRTDQGDIARAMTGAIGLRQIEVEFVPPGYITKTSSGKINRRKTATDWRGVLDARHATRTGPVNAVAELTESFATVRWDLPVEEVLDSLSLTVLRISLNDSNFRYDGRRTLAEIMAALQHGGVDRTSQEGETIRIVSLACSTLLGRLEESHVTQLAAMAGCSVEIEHVCLPPTAVLLSDLIFNEYFQPRLDSAAFEAVDAVLAKLRNASVIIVDDVAEMFFPLAQVYGALSHKLERDPQADLLVVRWQNYARQHDKLPLTLVAGCDIPLKNSSLIMDSLSTYLGTPLFRVARIATFARFTEGWEYRRLQDSAITSPAPEDFIESLATFLNAPGRQLKRFPSRASNLLQRGDLAHYCAQFVNRDPVDKILNRFDSFYIAGQQSSVPYLQKQIAALGKRFVLIPSYAPQVINGLAEPCQCLLICGAMGRFDIDLPAAALQFTEHSWHLQMMPELDLDKVPFNTLPSQISHDWFYPYDRVRHSNHADFVRSRTADRAARARPKSGLA